MRGARQRTKTARLLVCALLFGTAVAATELPARSAVGPTTRSMSYLNAPLALARGAVDTSQPKVNRPQPLSVLDPSGACTTWPYSDPAGDTRGGVDVISYRFEEHCNEPEAWVFEIDANRTLSRTQPAFVELDIDTDNNFTNNCDGIDYSMVVEFLPASSTYDVYEVQWKPGCTANQFGMPLRYSRSRGPNTFTFDFNSLGTMGATTTPHNWIAWTSGMFDAHGSQYERMPNTGSHTVTKTSMSMFRKAAALDLYSRFTQTVAGDFDGDGSKDDIYTYQRGTAPDTVWLTLANGLIAQRSMPLTGAYQLIPGDFNGDRRTDLFLYAPGTAPDYIWRIDASGGHTSQNIAVNGTYAVTAGDLDGDGDDDLAFTSAALHGDNIWWSNGTGFDPAPMPFAVDGTHNIVTGDFNGDFVADLLIYKAGHVSDTVEFGHADRTFTSARAAINGTYARLRSADFNGDGYDDVFFWNPGVGNDTMVYGSPTTSSHLTPGPAVRVNESYSELLAMNQNSDRADDLVFASNNTGFVPFYGHQPSLRLLTKALPRELVGHAYSTTPLASGGVAPYTWSAHNLPAGLTMDPTTGTITGTVNIAGHQDVRIVATDATLVRVSAEYTLNFFSGFKKVTAGSTAACALSAVGQVQCWGDNSHGALGVDQSKTPWSATPVEPPGLGTGVVDVAAGDVGACAVLQFGNVVCWGGVYGTFGPALDPVDGLSGPAVQVAFPDGQPCVLLASGDVQCWGFNAEGQLGDGTKIDSASPRTVLGINHHAVAIAGRCALLDTGAAKCWGYGIGPTPVTPVGWDHGITEVAGSCAILTGGRAQCFGFNGFGQLGIGTSDFAFSDPVQVLGLTNGVNTLGASGEVFHVCAMLDDGTARCWGRGAFGELGNGLITDSSAPVVVLGIDPSTTGMTAGFNSTCSWSSRNAYCWGSNTLGLLGTGTSTVVRSPQLPVAGIWN